MYERGGHVDSNRLISGASSTLRHQHTLSPQGLQDAHQLQVNKQALAAESAFLCTQGHLSSAHSEYLLQNWSLDKLEPGSISYSLPQSDISKSQSCIMTPSRCSWPPISHPALCQDQQTHAYRNLQEDRQIVCLADAEPATASLLPAASFISLGSRHSTTSAQLSADATNPRQQYAEWQCWKLPCRPGKPCCCL